MNQTTLLNDWTPLSTIDGNPTPEHNTQDINIKEKQSDIHPRHLSQKDKIMSLLKDYDIVPTKMILSAGIYQYNARIKELRQDLNPKGEDIVSVYQDGVYGFRHEVKHE